MDFEEFLWAMGMPQKVMDSVCGSISFMSPIDDAFFRVFIETYDRYMVGGMPEAVKAYSEFRMFTGLYRIFNELYLALHG